LLAEAGTQWGATVGVVDRVAVAPAVGSCAAGTAQPGIWRWTRFGLPGALAAGTWYLSPFYLRGEHIPLPCFTRRATYGAAATTGAELSALSIGIATRTYTRPPPDAITVLHFDDARPLDTRLSVWGADAPGELPVATIVKEVNP
jgi:hypothetical protein